MNQVKAEEKYQPHAQVPCIDTAVYQQATHNQCFGFFQGAPVNFLPEGAQTLPSMTMTNTQTPLPPPSTFQYYKEMMHCMQNCCMPPWPGGPVQFLPEGTQTLPPVAMISTQTPAAPLNAAVYDRETPDEPHPNSEPAAPGSAGDLTACQLQKPSCSLPQGLAGASGHGPKKPVEDALQKRELRLMKNREAARECRRKKKEYVRCLENRVAVLENQNKTLIEELRALKDIYRHKAE